MKDAILIQRNKNGWIVGPYAEKNPITFSETMAFNDFIDLCAYLGEYYEAEIRPEAGAESSEAGDD